MESIAHPYSGRTHILVFAPTQSGKGRGIVIPTLLTWPHSVIVHDLKGENWALTAVPAAPGPLCLKFEPAHPTGLARFNPLARCGCAHLTRCATYRTSCSCAGTLTAADSRTTGRALARRHSRRSSSTGSMKEANLRFGGVGNLLFDPERKADETVEHLMRAEHDPTGALGWKDRMAIRPDSSLVAVGCAVCSTWRRRSGLRSSRR